MRCCISASHPRNLFLMNKWLEGLSAVSIQSRTALSLSEPETGGHPMPLGTHWPSFRYCLEDPSFVSVVTLYSFSGQDPKQCLICDLLPEQSPLSFASVKTKPVRAELSGTLQQCFFHTHCLSLVTLLASVRVSQFRRPFWKLWFYQINFLLYLASFLEWPE